MCGSPSLYVPLTSIGYFPIRSFWFGVNPLWRILRSLSIILPRFEISSPDQDPPLSWALQYSFPLNFFPHPILRTPPSLLNPFIRSPNSSPPFITLKHCQEFSPLLSNHALFLTPPPLFTLCCIPYIVPPKRHEPRKAPSDINPPENLKKDAFSLFYIVSVRCKSLDGSKVQNVDDCLSHQH